MLRLSDCLEHATASLGCGRAGLGGRSEDAASEGLGWWGSRKRRRPRVCRRHLPGQAIYKPDCTSPQNSWNAPSTSVLITRIRHLSFSY